MLTVFKEKLPAPARHFHPNCQAFLTQDRPVFAANAAKAPSCVLFTQAADVAASCNGRQVRAHPVSLIFTLHALAAPKFLLRRQNLIRNAAEIVAIRVDRSKSETDVRQRNCVFATKNGFLI